MHFSWCFKMSPLFRYWYCGILSAIFTALVIGRTHFTNYINFSAPSQGVRWHYEIYCQFHVMTQSVHVFTRFSAGNVLAFREPFLKWSPIILNWNSVIPESFRDFSRIIVWISEYWIFMRTFLFSFCLTERSEIITLVYIKAYKYFKKCFWFRSHYIFWTIHYSGLIHTLSESYLVLLCIFQMLTFLFLNWFYVVTSRRFLWIVSI